MSTEAGAGILVGVTERVTGRAGKTFPGSRFTALRRVAGGFEMNVVDEPAAAVRAHEMDRDHLVTATGPLQFDLKRAQPILAVDGERAVENAIVGVVEVDLDDGEAAVQVLGIHVAGRGAALAAPEVLHPVEIVRLYGGHELRQGLLERLRGRRPFPLPPRDAAHAHEHGRSGAPLPSSMCARVNRRESRA